MKDGKVFGKINIIDLIVIVVALIIVVAVALKVTGLVGPTRRATGTAINYTVKVENVEPEVYENITAFIAAGKAAGYPGDQLMASGELLSGYITDVTYTVHPTEATVSALEGGISLYVNNGEKYDLVFTIQAQVDNNVTTEVGTQEVRVGKSHIVKTTHFELTYGTILSCEWTGGTGAGF